MLIARPMLERIVAGEVTLQFRRWGRPTVRTGGRLRTALGELSIDAVEPVTLSSITAADARAAGEATRASFKADVRRLKELGLTESLAVGYRLSPRGRAFVARTDATRRR